MDLRVTHGLEGYRQKDGGIEMYVTPELDHIT